MRPEDDALAQAIANAHHFTCTILVGGTYRTARFRLLAEARAYMPTLEAKAGNGKLAMCYVVTLAGTTHFIPRGWEERHG